MSVLPASVSVGSVLSFAYPTDNRVKVSTRLRRRRFVVESIRDCAANPIEPWAIALRPDLRRGRFLLVGRDLELHDTRQFYLSSARSVKLIDSPISQLAFYDPTRNGPLQFFGSLWTDSREDMLQVRYVIRNVNAMLNKRPGLVLSVGLFPYPQGVADVHSRQSA